MVSSEPEQVAALGDATRAVCATFGLGAAAAAEVELAVVEAINNCIEHAYRYEPGQTIEVILGAGDPGVEIEVRDRGRSIPEGVLEQARAQTFDPDDLAGVPEGGMGLGILKMLMKNVSYRTGNGVNVLSMSRSNDDGERPGEDTAKGG